MNDERRPTWTKLLAAGGSFLIVAALVVTTSGAVFTGSTTNAGNELSAATVSLTDNGGGSALFQVTGLIPNDTITRCIEVTYDGSATGADLAVVKLFSNADYNDSPGTFDTVLDLAVSIGDADDTCASADGWTELTSTVPQETISSFSGSYSDYSTGLSTGWTPSATPETRAFQFFVQFQSSADDTYQNAALGTTTPLDFTWEVQSGSGSAK